MYIIGILIVKMKLIKKYMNDYYWYYYDKNVVPWLLRVEYCSEVMNL